jgi:hypothetical protein
VELTESLRRELIERLIRAIRVHRDAIVLSLESAIAAGLVADSERFLLQGIAEIKSVEAARSILAFRRNTACENARQKLLRQVAGEADRTATHRELRSA